MAIQQCHIAEIFCLLHTDTRDYRVFAVLQQEKNHRVLHTLFFPNKNILTKGSLSGTNPKTADTSNSWGEGTEHAEAAEAIKTKNKRWESGNG